MLGAVDSFAEIAKWLHMVVASYWIRKSIVQDQTLKITYTICSNSFVPSNPVPFYSTIEAEPAQPTTIPQVNKTGKDKKENERTKEVEENKADDKSEKEKKKSKKENEKESKNEKEKGSSVRKEKVEEIKGNKEEGQQKGLNPIVTPVSDEDEQPAETQNVTKVSTEVPVNATQEEKDEKNIKTEETQASKLQPAI